MYVCMCIPWRVLGVLLPISGSPKVKRKRRLRNAATNRNRGFNTLRVTLYFSSRCQSLLLHLVTYERKKIHPMMSYPLARTHSLIMWLLRISLSSKAKGYFQTTETIGRVQSQRTDRKQVNFETC